MKTYFKLLFGLVLFFNYLTTYANTTSQLSNQNTNSQNKQYTLQKTISPKLDGLIGFDNDIVGVAPNGYTLSAGVSINPYTGDAFVVGSTNLGLYGVPAVKGVKSSFFIRKYAALDYLESSVCNPIYQCYLQQPSYINRWNISESYHATAIDASKNNKLYVVGNLNLVPKSDKVSYHDYFFGVYDDNLTQLWFNTSSNTFDDQKGKIIAKSVAADYNGNVYVVGTEDYFLKGVKKNKVAFINTYDEEFFGGYTGEFDYSESADKEYTGIFIDSLNHVLVVENEYEHAKGSSTITQANTIIKKFYKTSQDGPLSEIWQATIKPDQNFGDTAGEVIGYGITTDLYNNVYVVGTTNSSISGKKLTGVKDMFIAKYNESGALQWTQLLGSQDGITIASAVTADYDGKVYVTGSTTKPPFSRPQLGNIDAFIMVYDVFGRPSAFMQEGNQGGITAGQGIAIDNLNDRIYITGNTNVGFLGSSAISTKSNYFLANLWYWEERKNLYFKSFATNTLSFNAMLASTKNNSTAKLVRTSTR